jgi:hypothetical protein
LLGPSCALPNSASCVRTPPFALPPTFGECWTPNNFGLQPLDCFLRLDLRQFLHTFRCQSSRRKLCHLASRVALTFYHESSRFFGGLWAATAFGRSAGVASEQRGPSRRTSQQMPVTLAPVRGAPGTPATSGPRFSACLPLMALSHLMFRSHGS